MAITAKALVPAKFASSTVNTEYTVPAATRTIIDKFTVTNTDATSQVATVYLVPSGGTAGASNEIISFSLGSGGAVFDLSSLQNQILGAGESIAVVASVASKMVFRVSGREIT